MLKFFPDQLFEAFHVGAKTKLLQDHVAAIDRWLRIEEAVCYLNLLEIDSKKNVLYEQANMLNSIKVGQPKYMTDFTVRAFEYFATSCSLYNRLPEDFQLPSITT